MTLSRLAISKVPPGTTGATGATGAAGAGVGAGRETIAK